MKDWGFGDGYKYSQDLGGFVMGDSYLPETLEEATVAGIAWLLRERLETAGAEGLEELAPRLAEIALGPYTGGAEPPRLALAEGGG